jgi:DNA-binding CsgD family transcriptional regulator
MIHEALSLELHEEVQPLQEHLPTAPRQCEVWRMTALGLSDKEIGRAIGVSSATAKNHGTTLRLKLGVNNRVELALAAVHTGLITPEDIAQRLSAIQGRLPTADRQFRTHPQP